MTLAASDQAAMAFDPATDLDEATQTCPSAPRYHRIAVEIVGEDGVGLAGIRLVLAKSSGEQIKGKSGATGRFVFKGLLADSYRLALPELDRDAWEVIEDLALPGGGPLPGGTEAAWKQAVPTAPPAAGKHEVLQGECIAKLGLQYGLLPLTIWNDPANATLRQQRDNPYILLPGDLVAIPAKRVNKHQVGIDRQLRIRRKGVPERLRIRFLNHDYTPRADYPYLLSIQNAAGTPLADIRARTDSDGMVEATIPPDAIAATISLGLGAEPEVHHFDLGYLNPVEDVAGWKARLNNLGYQCGDGDDAGDSATVSAIEGFQRDQGLPIDGSMNDSTSATLLKLSLS